MLLRGQGRGKHLRRRRVVRNIQQPFDAIVLDAVATAHKLDLGQYRRRQRLVRRLFQSCRSQKSEHRGGVADLEFAAQPGLRY